MPSTLAKLGACTFEILTADDAPATFRGIGKVWIGEVLVRSGRLPWRVTTQTFAGLEVARLVLLGVKSSKAEVRVRLQVEFRRQLSQMMRDHSFDPIHDTRDWDAPGIAGTGALDLVFMPAKDHFGDVPFAGFAFRYEYASKDVPLFFLYDQASWELEGDIAGATAVSQSSCSAPVAHFAADTAWSTEGIIHWADPNSKANPVMTHNLPRWASHQAFDYQYKGAHTLVGVWERVELIRSVLQRDAGKPELKTFDKYIFDQALEYRSPAKAILLNTAPRSAIGQANLWTWVIETVHRRARAEFGLEEEPMRPRLSVNFWENFTIDSYYKDLLPAAVAVGFKQLFVDNLNKSSMTELQPSVEHHWNMCCGHEYEPAPRLGGPAKLKAFVAACAEHGIMPMSWTNNDQAHSSPVGFKHPDWIVKKEDTRLPYGGAYAGCFSILHFGLPAARQYWVDCLKKTRSETGLAGYLFDSFYNLGFMPVDYRDCTPNTLWRGTLAGFKELQDADVHFLIESFGPFGQVQHGCPRSYNLDVLFACYKAPLGTGYTTVPTGQDQPQPAPWPVADYYRILAHATDGSMQLFYGGTRVDKLVSEGHKQALRDYYAALPQLGQRFIQEDGRGVLWHDRAGTRATLFNFAKRTLALPGKVLDLSTGTALPKAATYKLLPQHTYVITGVKALPQQVG